jgi:S1-C subfamily serine protease
VSPQHVLTAHYLVMGASKTALTALDGRERRVTRAAVHHESGFALISFDGPPLLPVQLGPGASAGMPVFIVSSTGERERKGATGHISAVAPFEAFWEYMLDRAIMTTVVNPGLAGAPLFDGEARLVGLVSLGLASVARYSLAIPIDLYLDHRDELEGAPPRRARRAWVGIYPQGFDGGVVLTGVVPSGPADRAGLTKGDLLLSVDGQSVSSLRDLYQAIWRHEPGQALGVQILRDSAIRTVDVVAADRYEFYK